MKKLVTATMVLGLSATASAQLLGSDTLFEMINDPVNGILQNCPNARAQGITYLGTGSGAGETGMRNDAMEIAPMSRFLNNAAANTCRTPGQSGCYLHSLDALSIIANGNNTNGGASGGVCDTLNYGKSLPSGFALTDWRTVLRIIYGGISSSQITHDACSQFAPSRSPIAQKECNSAVRQELVNNWGNLFQNACTDGDCTQLKHAFRRDDVSGTTDVFLELLALPAITATPFCNGTDTQDTDPVRRSCDQQGRGTLTVPEQWAGEQVCSRTLNLGVVLPIIIPSNDPYMLGAAAVRDRGAGDCPTSWEQDQALPLCSPTPTGGQFQAVVPPPGITTCPVGNQAAGLCLWPKVVGSASGTGYACINGRNNLPGAIPVGTQDGRAWNLWPKRNSGSHVTFARGGVSQPMLSAFYRLHMTAQIASSIVSGSPTAEPTGDRPSGFTIPATVINGTAFDARTVAKGCMFADSTEQIGCLVEASPCSIGYAGLGAGNPDPACGSATNRREMAILTPAGGGITAAPSKASVRRFLDPSGAGCAAAGDFDQRYPLSRGLFLCTMDGVPDPLTGAGTTVGTQTTAFLRGQGELAACFQNRTIVDNAVNATGFITLDDLGAAGMPITKRLCQ